MKLGIFAKTFNRPTIEELFQSIASYGINSVQFNLSCARLEPLPKHVPSGCNQQQVLDEAFALLGDSILIAHAKDRNKDFQTCAAGKGILDFEYYLKCAKQSGFNGPIIMHGLEERDVAFARSFVRQRLAQAGFIL
jgi:sugar phosphate isomerase/epimerase